MNPNRLPFSAIFALGCVLPYGAGAAEDRGNPSTSEMRSSDRDPARMVTMMMSQFDKNGDQRLDVQELTALLTMMRERRVQFGGQPGMSPIMENRKDAGGLPGRRDVRDDGTDDAGGVRPKRPPAE